MPEPEVNVSQAQPQVQVRQSEPQVQVRPAQPQVQVESAQPQVQVQQLADAQPNVQVEGNRQPRIRYEQAEPRVVVNRQEGQPQIRMEQAGQGQEAGQAQQQAMAADPGAAPGATSARSPLEGMRVEELMDKPVYGAGGLEIGDIENVVVSREGRAGALVVGVGGFLGIGERQVAIPFDQVRMEPNGRLVTDFDKQRVSQMQAYDEGGFERINPGQEIGTTLNR
jgi:sporulation protein YlmC with PRC-barrel domain